MSSFKNRLAIAAVLVYYLWAGTAFNVLDPNGYYNYLARGFATGHLYVPIEVNPKLLALPNPYDPKVPDELKMHDMAMYKGHYFLYHGVAPALFAFLPYRLFSGKDLPEAVAVILFVSIAFLCNAFSLAAPTPPTLLALGLANCIPFLLHRVFVYEVAIACGYCFLSAAFCFYLRDRFRCAGLFFGLAVLARPHLGLALLFVNPRTWPTATIGIAAVAAYNYLRFDSPFDFGLQYLLAGPNQQVPQYGMSKVLPSLYYFVLKAPVFPLLEINGSAPFGPRPGFVVENIMGCLWLAPFIVFQKPSRLLYAGLALVLFLSSTGWITQRYEVDFLPWLVLAALRNPVPQALLYIGIFFNLVLHWRGPYNAP